MSYAAFSPALVAFGLSVVIRRYPLFRLARARGFLQTVRRFHLHEGLSHDALTLHQLLIDASVGCLGQRLLIRAKFMWRAGRRQDTIADGEFGRGDRWSVVVLVAAIFTNVSHFSATFSFFTVSDD